MKGILLAGGQGSRLYPITSSASKHLACVYDKPMIYYPLSTLMLSGIREVVLISTPHDIPMFQRLLGDGSRLGIQIHYEEQEKPEGVAQAFLIAEPYIRGESVCLILGDNIFYGNGLDTQLHGKHSMGEGGLVFGYWVNDPERYGVIEFDEDKRIVGIEEKPSEPKSNYAVPGLYFYSSSVLDIAKTLVPSARGELEITDINKHYLQQQTLQVELLGRGIAWLDTGTPQSLLEASSFVAAIEKRQGLKIACLEEIAYRMGYITLSQLESNIQRMPKSEYKEYLLKLFLHEFAADRHFVT
ncbi:glucose-1-phosphate thymidylyltransferase [Paenibacillus zeisoli]|uniref:Glucose-1-phosphate thymidylyltransferase n=1 Tax=Paenibacillus zeisoli TaxID=2496267 RepID=A0A433X667_9BACL|nr:glucose-1-phosphate thymidylyltransferase RfbA [Paenibacillus zeisoli]RUT29635.1 glucose-1-phosphate thymidylyltransferase [Paenibacillus zeisoli]